MHEIKTPGHSLKELQETIYIQLWHKTAHSNKKYIDIYIQIYRNNPVVYLASAGREFIAFF